MLKKITLALIATLSLSAHAQEEFIHLVDTKDKVFYVQPSSFVTGEIEKGLTIALVNVKYESKITKDVEFSKAYIDVKSCEDKEGVLVLTKLSGKSMGRLDFVIGGGNVASLVAEVLCLGYKKVQERKAV